MRKSLKNFRSDESGSILVEALLALPVLLWAIAATFTYFDGFRQSASNLKAAFTVSDLISRETRTITETYLDSMHELMELMVDNGTQMNVRISLIAFDEDDDRHYVRWSGIRGFDEEWTDDNIHLIRDKLPPMPNADTLILVETSNTYVPFFNVGLGNNITFDNFVFTRPRFTNEIAGSV
ncbi:pilus assembly protein [Ruegeria sediminis]|uniref:Pilus assembly protein n=1 Tax=Ruegeria sediminis TaxID=2583820 RepID=A0ABY2WYT4_9RHOB|nr:pilus assembly protein [Ruegeria sediminis]TMV08035.1 pilus assembly protein [Ruegeria sediminis]